MSVEIVIVIVAGVSIAAAFYYAGYVMARLSKHGG
ncbi:hypothetical protein ES708_34233 [subsurface metagenome]